MPKEFTYRGHTVDELKELSLEELAEVMPSRIRRTLKRGLSPQNKKLLEKIRKHNKKGVEGVIRTHRRDFPVLPEMVGMSFAVYNGRQYIEIEISPKMVGRFLGEFSVTNKVVRHGVPGKGATRSSKYIPLK